MLTTGANCRAQGPRDIFRFLGWYVSITFLINRSEVSHNSDNIPVSETKSQEQNNLELVGID